MTVKERLRQFISYKGIPTREFERLAGLSYGYVNNMRVSIQPDKVANITAQYPELNTGWLLTGEGEMLKTHKSDDDSVSSDKDTVKRLLSLTESQQRIIENLSETIRHLTRK